MNKRAVLILMLLIAAAVLAIILGRLKNQPLGRDVLLDEFARCLAGRGVMMYGAAWCSHCQDQKKLFGSSFQFIPYVECPQNPQECLAKDINAYPTWILGDGRRLIGKQGLEKLAAMSGCRLPSEPLLKNK